MKNLKKFLAVTSVLAFLSSCEPEELPQSTYPTNENISADSGDQGQEIEHREDE